MKVMLTGADGFIGKNLRVAISEQEGLDVLPITRGSTPAELNAAASQADVLIHLAGVNRPQDPAEFSAVNTDFTASLCAVLLASGRSVPVAFASSIQAVNDSPYGKSKLAAEEVLTEYAEQSGAAVAIYRLANVFGKWCKPNYNSAVATFCYNRTRGLPIQVNDPEAPLQLIYIDDLVSTLLAFLFEPTEGVKLAEAGPIYETTVGKLAGHIESFSDVRKSLVTERVGGGLARALYATYVSYLEPETFGYSIRKYEDSRGVFVEMLKTKDSGQFSVFTARPGITRGGHYHHTKTEKFLVIKGLARFGFRHILTDEAYSLDTSGDDPTIVETIPGWAHDITNVGKEELVVMLWANEIFDRERPDTFTSDVLT